MFLTHSLTNPTYMITNHQRHRQTDGRTTYRGNTALALCTSRGKSAHGDYRGPESESMYNVILSIFLFFVQSAICPSFDQWCVPS